MHTGNDATIFNFSWESACFDKASHLSPHFERIVQHVPNVPENALKLSHRYVPVGKCDMIGLTFKIPARQKWFVDSGVLAGKSEELLQAYDHNL